MWHELNSRNILSVLLWTHCDRTKKGRISDTEQFYCGFEKWYHQQKKILVDKRILKVERWSPFPSSKNEIRGIQYFMPMFNSKTNINNILKHILLPNSNGMKWATPRREFKFARRRSDRSKIAYMIGKLCKAPREIVFTSFRIFTSKEIKSNLRKKNIQELIVMCARRKSRHEFFSSHFQIAVLGYTRTHFMFNSNHLRLKVLDKECIKYVGKQSAQYHYRESSTA